jgi:hypothetical protein
VVTATALSLANVARRSRRSVALLLLPLLSIASTGPASRNAAPDAADPALTRLKLLAAMDARIDAAAARGHLEARILLDETMPIAFFGVVADPVADPHGSTGMKVTQVYPETAAEAAGVRAGDVIADFAGVATDSKAALFGTIRRHAVGERVGLRVRRGEESLTLAATLRARAEEDEEDEEQFPDLAPTNGAAAPARGLPVTLDFEHDELGATPRTLDVLLGGHGAAPRFVVVRDELGARLRQDDGDRTGLRFPIALVKDVDAADVVARVRFKLDGGVVDRAAGLVLRLQDASNHLVARVNSIEGDLRVFRVVNGMRRTLPGGVANVAIADGVWHELEFSAVGPRVTAVLDGTTRLACFDTYFRRGRVGLWTKADSLTEFDQLEVTEPPRDEARNATLDAKATVPASR